MYILLSLRRFDGGLAGDGDEIKIYCFFVKIMDECCEALIVQFLEFRSETAGHQEPMRALV